MTDTVDQAAVLSALSAVKDPDLHKDIVNLGFVKDLTIENDRICFKIELTTPACPVKDQMRDQAHAAVLALPGVSNVQVEMTASVRAAATADAARAPLAGVKNVIAVGAGKGGVGKTTVAVNLAIALAKCGGRVGMIDGDIYGPNVPIMLGMQAQLTTDGKKIVPAERYGLSVVSMGFLAQDDAAVIWRGPMLHGIIQQFFSRRSMGRAGLSRRRHAAWYGRRGTEPEPDCSCRGRDRRDHAPDSVGRRQPTGHSHVPKAQHSYAGRDREHEPLRLPTVQQRERHLRQGRRRADGQGSGHSVSGQHSYLRADQGRERHGRAHHGRRA